MADEEDINGIKRDMEDLDARIDQLEDLQLTNKLNIIELRKEFDSFENHLENSGNLDVSKDVEKTLERMEEEKKDLSDWKKRFKDIDKRLKGFNKKVNKIEDRLDSGTEKISEGVTDNKVNRCDSCGMNNDLDAKYCIVCGNEL